MTRSLGFLGREEFCEEFCSFFPSVLFLFCAHTFCELILSLAPPSPERWEPRSCGRLELAVGLSRQDARERLDGSRAARTCGCSMPGIQKVC